MASIRTQRGKLYYKPVNIYLGIKRMDRDIAFENLKIVIRVLKENGIRASLAYGTLLGIVRDGNFIEWDEDIDFFVRKEEKDLLLGAFWDLKAEGFELVRAVRCGYLYSIMRNGEYIDFYIQEKISPEVRTNYGGGFIFEKYLSDLVEYNFRGLDVLVPREYEEYLSFIYGDWRTPVQWADYEMPKRKIVIAKLNNSLKSLLPKPLRFYLLKEHHRKDFDKFLAKCKKKNIILKYPIKY